MKRNIEWKLNRLVMKFISGLVMFSDRLMNSE